MSKRKCVRCKGENSVLIQDKTGRWMEVPCPKCDGGRKRMTDLRKQVEGLRELSKKWRNYKPTPYEREAQPTGYIRDTYTACADELDALLAEPVEAGAGQQMETAGCGQHERDKEILKMLDPEITFYGPYACGCGDTICRASNAQGGMAFDYPATPIYPNTNWIQHVCKPRTGFLPYDKQQELNEKLHREHGELPCESGTCRICNERREEPLIPQRARDFEAGFQTGVKKQAAAQAKREEPPEWQLEASAQAHEWLCGNFNENFPLNGSSHKSLTKLLINFARNSALVREEPPAGEPRRDYTLVPNSALRWLFGEEGIFEDPNPSGKYKRPYWWRSEFRKKIEVGNHILHHFDPEIHESCCHQENGKTCNRTDAHSHTAALATHEAGKESKPPDPTAERPVWIRAIALPQGPEQNCVNVRVRDDASEKLFVMEPEDVRED